MTKRGHLISLVASGLALLALTGLSFWQTSLDFGDFRPENSTTTFVLWAVSTFVVIGTVALAFVVSRNLLKLYIERRQNKLGSHIKTKLVAGALALSVLPVALHVTFSISLLNRNVDKWFSQPTIAILRGSETVMAHANDVILRKTRNDVARVAAMPETAASLRDGGASAMVEQIAREVNAEYLALLPAGEREPVVEIHAGEVISGPTAWRLPNLSSTGQASGIENGLVFATAPILVEGVSTGTALIAWAIPEEIEREQALMRAQAQQWKELEGRRPVVWRSYLGLLALFALFILFTAVWLALFASKQIIRPIEALVTATGEYAGGHLDYRVRTPAIDELAGLVESFNQMGQALELKTDQLKRSNRDLAVANTELDSRRRFINAILESITPGVVSVSDEGEILKFNESAAKIFAPRSIAGSNNVSDLFEGSDRDALRAMLKRAQRTGLANRDFVTERHGRTTHLSVTVSSLEPEESEHGFVVVFEDTTEIMRAQRSEAWQEVARRLAHEIKNPLTPIALSAERINKLLDRYEQADSDERRRALQLRLEQSTSIIGREVESLKTLVNDFSDLARFPALRPSATDLNALVADAVALFDGRVPGVKLRFEAGGELPPAQLDPEPFKRVIVNLIDNAVEAVDGCWVREVVVSTAVGTSGETLEFVVADSGPGISPEDKVKLFLPYFSTKDRGTGLGLPIVSRIVSDHLGTIRVEANQPTGSRFIVEIPSAGDRVISTDGVIA